jgi:CRP-like cAMP-binding protein
MHEKFAQHWLVRGMTPDEMAAVYELGELVEVALDEIVIQADRPNDTLFLLLEGACKVNLPNRSGRDGGLTLGHRGPGDLLGEYSFVDRVEPAAQVTASTPGLALRIPHNAMRELLDGNYRLSSVVYRNMLGHLIERLRAQDEEVACLLV